MLLILTDTKDGTDNGTAGEDRGGHEKVGVDEVVRDAEEEKDKTSSVRHGRDYGGNPVDTRRHARPREDEETDAGVKQAPQRILTEEE